MTIRKALSEDAKAIAVILKTSRLAAMPYLPHDHTPEEDHAFVRDSVLKECEVYIAEDQDVPIGFIAFKDAWIEHLYLLPEAQGRGIGSDLLNIART